MSDTQNFNNAADGGLPRTPCSASYEWKERLAAYRKEHFAVTTAAPRKVGDTVTLSITTNGNQWQTIGLMPEEIQRVIDALIPFLPNVRPLATGESAADRSE
jgi:hypothetical protein